MNKSQMEMLSVKNTIERVVQGYIISYDTCLKTESLTPYNASTAFWCEVERLVACMFVSQQIDNNYSIQSNPQGNLEIRFTTQQQSSGVTFLLPLGLRYSKTDTVRLSVQETLFSASELCAAWQVKGKAESFEVECEANHEANPSNRTGDPQSVSTDPRLKSLPGSGLGYIHQSQTNIPDTPSETADPTLAYDRAKKFVEHS